MYNFTANSLSMTRSQALGARAWAQGKDVYFGKGGFDPKVAAHELVHTVQQGAVKGSVSESVPMSTVQMLPLKNEGKVKRFDNNTDFGQVMGGGPFHGRNPWRTAKSKIVLQLCIRHPGN